MKLTESVATESVANSPSATCPSLSSTARYDKHVRRDDTHVDTLCQLHTLALDKHVETVETIHISVETMDMRVEVLRKLCRVYTCCAVSLHVVPCLYMLCIHVVPCLYMLCIHVVPCVYMLCRVYTCCQTCPCLHVVQGALPCQSLPGQINPDELEVKAVGGVV